MSGRTLLLVLTLFFASCGRPDPGGAPDLLSGLDSYEHLPGYFDLYWDENEGRLIVRIDRFDDEFLYQSSMARGVGSNDIGLDRGQLGATRVVRFQR